MMMESRFRRSGGRFGSVFFRRYGGSWFRFCILDWRLVNKRTLSCGCNIIIKMF